MQANSLKQRKTLSRENVCLASLWLTEEHCNSQLERASRKIVDWHNKLRQPAEPGRTQAEGKEKKKSCSCSCLRHHRNECHMGSQNFLQVSSPGSHPRKSSSLYTQKKQFLYHLLHSWCSHASQWVRTDLLDVSTSCLSDHFSAATVSCPIDTIALINT